MRKDVKLGFAIGGVLLAVLIVYVLVISGGDNTPSDVSLVTSDAQSIPAEDVSATPSPERPAETAAAEPPTDPFRPTSPAEPASPEADPIDRAPSASEDRWLAALNTGRLPVMMTETPVPPVVPAPEPVPAEANLPAPTSLTPSAAPVAAVAPAAASNLPAAVTADAELGPATRPSSAAPASSPRSHIVQTGESFATIAAEVYGSSAYYPHLIRANPTINPRRLKPGMTIVLPPASEVRADSGVSAPAAPSASLDARTEYRVQPGDSLYKISMKLYGKADRAEKLYELNKASIGANPAKLKLGMVLKLPEAPTSTASAAR